MNRQPKATTNAAGSPKARILLVDDDSSVRETLMRVLVGEGYLVLPAASGPEGLKLAAGTQIDLVLLDLNMPGQGGWNTFESLATENPLVPVIIITARSNQLFTALASGVGALLEKPLDFPNLLQTIADLLAESEEQRLARMSGKPARLHYLPSAARQPIQAKDS